DRSPAPRGRPPCDFEPHGNAKHRRLAATRWADEHHDLSVMPFEVHAAERLPGVHRAIDAQREPLRYIVQGDFTHAAHPLLRWHRSERVSPHARVGPRALLAGTLRRL